MSVFGQKEFIIYSIFDIVIVSIISESLFRGEMFAALRQFGDAYAVIITSVLSGIFTQNFQIMAGTIIISAVSAIGCLRSGTVFSAIIARIVYKIFLLMLTIIASSNIPHVKTVKHIYLMLVLLVGLVTMIVIFSNKERREKTIFARYKAYVPMKKKLLAAVKSIPLIVAVVSCLFVAALKLAS
ncbi:MAG: CPBP family glutamic-type intramembrane protease [Ruminococcus sp.]|nr:CPBP family glutamic-type intramembrane protease [Ruminococcus sp.]